MVNGKNRNESQKASLFTTETVPEELGVVITEMYPMIQSVGTVVISKKNALRRLLDRNRNEFQEIVDNFTLLAPEKANAIIGVRISSATCQFSDGTYLVLTYTGTPVTFKKREDAVQQP